MKQQRDSYLMHTVQKTAKILRAFTREEPTLSLTDLHKKTGIGLSSLQRFVVTLVYEGLLMRDERTKLYRLGLSLFYLGKLVEQESSLLSVAKPALHALHEKYNESVSMSILDGNERRCIMNLDSTHVLTARNYVGDTSPLYAGASAKVLLAFLPVDEIERYLQQVTLQMITEHTTSNRQQLMAELADIREKGYALTYRERIAGACAVSAPIQIETSTRPIASIAVIIPHIRFETTNVDELITDVLATKQEIERLLR